MAGTITHAYFIMDVYDKLDKRKKELLKPYINNLKTFAQGHDIYDFVDSCKAYYFHTNDTRDFFINMINYIKDNDLKNNMEIISYLYGYLGHYILDKNVHPYIVYKAGRYDEDYKKETKKYRCKHSEMETYIDSYMIMNKEKIKPGKLKSQDFCLNPNKFSEELKKLIDTVFKETYDFDNAAKKYIKGIKKMRILYPLLRNDRFNIKKRVYSTVDKITPTGFYKFAPISFGYTTNKDQYLNLDKKTWNNPIDNKEKYNYSFIDIYNNSIEELLKIYKDVDNYLDNKKVNLNKVFDNSSFVTGKDCNDPRLIQYFEY